MNEAIFKGASGKLHRFVAAPPEADFTPAPAVYAFAKPNGRQWIPVFISRTANMAARMDRHPQWQEARRLGATHVLVHRRGERDAREEVEADLLAALRPVMNGPFNAGRNVATARRGGELVRLAPVAELADAWRARKRRAGF
jgi:hypothetical protein